MTASDFVARRLDTKFTGGLMRAGRGRCKPEFSRPLPPRKKEHPGPLRGPGVHERNTTGYLPVENRFLAARNGALVNEDFALPAGAALGCACIRAAISCSFT